MSLPLVYSNSQDYYEECIKFLRDYKQLYNFPNTEILIHNVLDKIDVSSFKDDDIFKKGFDLASNKESDEFLKDFFGKIERFKVSYNEFIEDHELEKRVDVPLSPKKKHEISYLAKEIAGMCEETNFDTVVDFGSGLGYLDQFIFEETHLNVLGLECNENHYVGAKKRQRKYHLDSTEKVKFVKHFISENSDQNIQGYLEDKFGNSKGFCITGLHACADLTIDAINLFIKMPNARAMVIMPCCYHKLSNTNVDTFKNFPMSECLKRIYEANSGFQFLRVPFLRLATQPPCILDEDLRDSVFNLVSRAVLQVYAYRHDIKLKRKKRKAVRMKTLDNNFTRYIEDAAIGYTSVSKSNEDFGTGELQLDFQELQNIWRETSESGALKKAAIFILLQNILQPVFENFLLFDRLVYLKEHGIECRFKKIFNEKISPRCLALVAYK